MRIAFPCDTHSAVCSVGGARLRIDIEDLANAGGQIDLWTKVFIELVVHWHSRLCSSELCARVNLSRFVLLQKEM